MKDSFVVRRQEEFTTHISNYMLAENIKCGSVKEAVDVMASGKKRNENEENKDTKSNSAAVKNRINERFDSILHHTTDGTDTVSCPYVCIVCDELLSRKNLNFISKDTLKKGSFILRSDGFAGLNNANLINCYKYDGPHNQEWMKDILLSKRACYVEKNPFSNDRRHVFGYSCCSECKLAISKEEMPEKAIANKYFFGTPPDCLLDLTDIEHALLNPVKSHGYWLQVTGGQQKNLKGVLSYFRVEEEEVANAVTKLEVLGLNKHIVILYSGHITKKQKEKCTENRTIRTDKVLDAIKWLVQNNVHWKHIDLERTRRDLESAKPIVIDRSTEVEDSTDPINSNIETTETLVAYFPDGSMRPVYGGQDSMEKFKLLVEQKNYKLHDLQYHCNQSAKRAAEYLDDNFERANILQFPFGRGGMNEIRMRNNGSLTDLTDPKRYSEHLSKISMPHFHTQVFVIMLYSMWQKQMMLRNSSLKLRNEVTCTEIARNLCADEVEATVSARRHKYSVHAPTSKSFLDAVDAVTKALPHTNAAASKARANAECLFHHFGPPAYFLTVSPDEETSFLMQVYTGVKIDGTEDIANLSDEQLFERSENRKQLRLKFPGMSAVCFEELLNIVLEEVVGVDVVNHEITGKGLFGKLDAAMASIEEQGRKSLHVHILLWKRDVQEAIEDAQTKIKRKNEHHNKVKRAFDDVSSTSLIANATKCDLAKMFAHECDGCSNDPMESISNIERADRQQLRNLRSKRGCKDTEHMLARCNACGKIWSHDKIVALYLATKHDFNDFRSYPDKHRKLNAHCIRYQKPFSKMLDKDIVNATVNTHFSNHTATCHPNKENNEYKAKDIDCRMRLPEDCRPHTTVNSVETDVLWYSWNGSKTKRNIIEILPKRAKFDEYQNVSCPAISESKMTCNTNIATLTMGPIVMYITKYHTKGNQKEETEEYNRACKATRDMLTNEETTRKHDIDRREAKRRILNASYAHNSVNIVGGPLASWLTRHGTRFLYSHEFVWCPTDDIYRLMRNCPIKMTLKTVGNSSFLENSAMHYLCRPEELENLCPWEFFSKYEVCFITKENKHEMLMFLNCHPYQHPSYNAKKNVFRQGCKQREKQLLVKFRQWAFPDSAEFNGNVLLKTTQVTNFTEDYSKQVLLLFSSYRRISDIMVDNTYTKALRKTFSDNKITPEIMKILQNVQDARSNCLRNPGHPDELARDTEQYKCWSGNNGEDSEPEQEDHVASKEEIDMFIKNVLGTNHRDSTNNNLHNMSFAKIRQKGSNMSGYAHLCNVGEKKTNDCGKNEFAVPHCQHTKPASQAEQDQTKKGSTDENKSKSDIVKVMLTCRSVRKRNVALMENVNAIEANGSAASIVEWGLKAKLDERQRRAFEVMTSAFVLTFYDRAKNEEEGRATRGAHYVLERKKLEAMRNLKKKEENLVCFVHGPGGCGKTTVIDLVRNYCKEFCDLLNHTFTSQTIAVTAITGVAATLLLGDTTHSSLYINKKGDLSCNEVSEWKDTRMLIVDEVSFAAPELIQKIDEQLRALTGNMMQKYGGMNVVFSGDLRQLKPPRQKSLSENECTEFFSWINCYIELEGRYRFNEDPKWGEMLSRFRNGLPTKSDIDKINERVVSFAKADIPDNVKYVTNTNKERDAINTALFMKHCEQNEGSDKTPPNDALLILSDQIQIKNGQGELIDYTAPKNFWETCGEDCVSFSYKSSERVDPVLKLFKGCPVMLTKNTDVKKAIANGTRATVEKVVLKPYQQVFQVVVEGTSVNAVYASQVELVCLKHENKLAMPQHFEMKPKLNTVKVQLGNLYNDNTEEQFVLKMKINQIPIVSNCATTCHKLQGTGVTNLFVSEWKKEANWIYVALSRVKTLNGLFLRKPLPYTLALYEMSQTLKSKIEKLRNEKTSQSLPDEMYKWLCDPKVSKNHRPPK